MSNNGGAQVGDVQGNALVAQVGGNLAGDLVARDKNITIIRNLTIYVSSRPEEPEQQMIVTDIGPNPYKGLTAFYEEDAARFFGREQLTQTLWEKFRRLHEIPLPTPSPSQEGSYGTTSEIPLLGGVGGGSSLRLLAILGPSGSGKSSVARAGLLPELARRPLPGRKRARVAVFTPGVKPLAALAVILARIITNDPSPVTKTRELAGELKLPNEYEEWDGLSRIAAVIPEIDAAPLIVLIDQFEEVYALCENGDERQQFINNLLYAAADRSGQVSVILTLRSDFLGQTQSHPELNHAIAANEVLTPVMNDAELRQAIAEPARQAGHPLDDATVALLIEQTRGREGALPLLQFALTRIWEGLAAGVQPVATLKQIGGVGGALAGAAQRLFDSLSDADKTIARRAFLGLVQLGEGARDTRRRLSVPEIVAHGEDPAHIQAVLRVFAQPGARLVTLSAGPDGRATAEVTHETLLEHWGTLQEWLDANRDDLRFHRRLAEAARHWDRQRRPEGLLWRPPDLDLLRQYYDRAGHELTPLELEFLQGSAALQAREQTEKEAQRQRELEAARQLAAAEAQARQKQAEAEYRARVLLIVSLVSHANQHILNHDREQAALLARQAYFLNQQYQCEVDNQITAALRLALAMPEGEADALVEQACQKATRNLTPAEWRQAVGRDDIPYVPCPGLAAPGEAGFVYRLRSKSLATDEVQDLSLNVKADGYLGTPVANQFEARGKIVVDHATGLMWEQAGSPKELNSEEAQQYLNTLNRQKFAGYADWRLPTVEELLSLMTRDKQSNDLYINPIFDKMQRWCWSADIEQIKGESSAEAVWRVYFRGGYVNAYGLDFQSYVRVVRSRQ